MKRLSPAGVLLALTLLLANEAAAATKIYRTVDQNGNVVFTDVPPKSEQEGRAVDLSQPNSFTPPENQQQPGLRAGAPAGDADGEAEDEDTAAAGAYRSLRIVQPAADEPVRDNAGNVTVIAAVEPDLHRRHELQLLLDGAVRQSGRSPTFQLENVDRGTHTVEVRIVDENGNTVTASDPSVFHLQRRSVLLQPAGQRRPN